MRIASAAGLGLMLAWSACADEPVESDLLTTDGAALGEAGPALADAGQASSAGGTSNDGSALRDGALGSSMRDGSSATDAAQRDDAASRPEAGLATDAGPRDAAITEAGSDGGMWSGVLVQLRGKTMYSSKPTGAATWLVNADANATRGSIDADMNAAGANRFPVFTLYRYYPNSGTDANAHRGWVTAVAQAIGRHRNNAVVVVEPDCFALKERGDTDNTLNTAIGILKQMAPNAAVFLDIGHSGWLPANTVLSRVKAYGNYAMIDGFASNTSNFQATAQEENYAAQLYAGSNKPVIIDTSRNGLGRVPSTIFNPPDSEWDPGPPFAWHPDNPAVFFNYYNKPSDERD